MIVCPNCNHQNPDGATQCEACYTPLPSMIVCPSCGAKNQADASFCGQCGFNLKAYAAQVQEPEPEEASTPTVPDGVETAPDFDIPDLPPIEPIPIPEPLVGGLGDPVPPPVIGEAAPPIPQVTPAAGEVAAVPGAAAAPSMTQIQVQTARLLHVQTDTPIELPSHLSVVHIGKPNDRIPPDVDVAGFPNSEIVSRIHADIRVEGDSYYLEDVGSSNGTYVNNLPLPMGNRHRLRPGDRISLGKGDKVSFIFQLS